jgi:hypothetical protein
MNIIRGPVIAMVVMVALTNVSLATSLVAQSDTTTTPASSEAQLESSTPSESGEASENSEQQPEPATSSDSGETLENSEAQPEPATSPESGETSESDETSTPPLEEQPLGIVVDMTKAPQEVLLVIAFILGWQSRLSVALLETIGERIFGKAWQKMNSVDENNK